MTESRELPRFDDLTTSLLLECLEGVQLNSGSGGEAERSSVVEERCSYLRALALKRQVYGDLRDGLGILARSADRLRAALWL